MSSKSALSYKSTKEASSASPAGDDANTLAGEKLGGVTCATLGPDEPSPNAGGLVVTEE